MCAVMREIVTRATRDRRFRVMHEETYKSISEDYNYFKQGIGLIMKRTITINYVIFFSVIFYAVFYNV